MKTKFTATKERAEATLRLLRRDGRQLPPAVYDEIHDFITACMSRLPHHATVAKHDKTRRRAVASR